MKNPNIIVSIVIPCLNEEHTISSSIRDAMKNGKKYFGNNFELIVADNGSTDDSLKFIKKNKNVKLINVPIRGYGAALHWGIMKANGDYVCFADADLSYPFSNLKKFKSVLTKSNPDLLLGSRIKGNIQKNAMPWLHRYFGTPVLTQLIRWIYKIPTTDCNSGMRVVKKSFYIKLNMRNSGMEWASELLLKTALKKGKYVETPITFRKDKRIKPPHLSTWSDGWRHLKAIFLLKPSSLYPLFIIFTFLSVLCYKYSFAVTFLFLDLMVVLLLSLLTLNLLGAVIEGVDNSASKFMKEFKFVPYVGFFAFLVGIIIIGIPDEHLGTKLFFISVLGIILMWVFFVETIKTHMVNRLPDM